MVESFKVLIIEDSEDDYDLLVRHISRAGITIDPKRIETRNELVSSLENHWDLIISDNSLPQFNAPEALKLTRKKNQNVPFLIVSGTIGEEAAVNAMRAGANDYILKGNLNRLLPAIEREIRESQNTQKRINIEKKLEQSEKMYQFLSGSIQDVFIALDHNLNILFWNEYAEKEFNRSLDIIGSPIYQVFPSWETNEVRETIEQVLTQGKSEHIAFEYNDSKYFEGSIYPTEDGISIIAKNVTEQKQVKENLLKINNELETLMYRISHDLKGPVASIKGLINIGMKDFEEKVEVQLLMKMLDNSTQMLNNTLNELLNITRIKQGQVNPDPFIINDLINDVLTGLKYSEGFDNIKIEMEIEPNVRVITDRRLMRSVLQNLLENAVKYRRRDVDNGYIHISLLHENNTTIIQIEDNGQGIPKKFQKHIFEMFYRANETSQGSGLGLYIVKSALDKINGAITLNSDKNKGSTFTVKIPDLIDNA
ncbi:sensor histidine kinase [Fulvivirga ligni]|uniref:sensor histidine kinase n=1 Tax=Fulvivirga ligni TaxID=2904246 RepID=UPI001F333D3C|nr:ATP-binding protein [Fulvivirga ligni]UII22372.1 ATP-binding protein [Fulvivirga ligni]